MTRIDLSPQTTGTALPDFQASAERVMQQCDELAMFSSLPDAISRSYLTPEHEQCNAAVAGWMQQAGMITHQDQAANICGRLVSPDPAASTLLIGSHLDSIPNAGKYDGILGVLIAVEAVDLLVKNQVRFPFHIDVVGFGDEEGTRFASTLLGSRAIAGTWDEDWFALKDKNNISMEQALHAFGCDPEQMKLSSRAGDSLVGYLEVHIEQGPVLEKLGRPLGVVTHIAGARRFQVTIEGMAGHAGTVPMSMRRDALVAAAEMVIQVEETAREFGIVATVGKLDCSPGAANVIPGLCRFTIDIRTDSKEILDNTLAVLQDRCANIIARRQLKSGWQEVHNAPAVKCANWIQQLFADALKDMGMEVTFMISGAGHDAMSLAPITDIGMLFIRCEDGISHHPDEKVTSEDTRAGIEALYRTLLKLKDKMDGEDHAA